MRPQEPGRAPSGRNVISRLQSPLSDCNRAREGINARTPTSSKMLWSKAWSNFGAFAHIRLVIVLLVLLIVIQLLATFAGIMMAANG